MLFFFEAESPAERHACCSIEMFCQSQFESGNARSLRSETWFYNTPLPTTLFRDPIFPMERLSIE